MNSNSILNRSLAIVLTTAVCLTPELGYALQTAQPGQQPSTQQQQTQQNSPGNQPITDQDATVQQSDPAQETGTRPAQQSATPQQGQAQPQSTAPRNTVDPAAGPLTPVPSTTQTTDSPGNAPAGNIPDAPSATPQPGTDQAQTPQRVTPRGEQNNKPSEPLGTAAAERARTAGGAASRPAGTAIAPAKQRQVRSLLIKLGAVAAAGAAVGIVYGLTRGTGPTPPGSRP